VSKKEEIRKGIEDIIDTDGIEIYRTFDIEKLCAGILKYLHSKGVVIKVEGELPALGFENSKAGVERFQLKLDTRKEMFKAGYVAVESLVNE